MDAHAVEGFCGRCNSAFEARCCNFHFCQFQECRLSLVEEKFQRGIEEKEIDKLLRQYLQEKCSSVTKTYECDWWMKRATDKIVQIFPLQNAIVKRKTLGKTQKYIFILNMLNVILKNQRGSGIFANFAPVFKNIKVARDDLGPLIKENVKKDGLMKNDKIRLLYMDHGTILTACFSFSWIRGWLAEKI